LVEHSNEPSGPIKVEEILDQLSDYQFLSLCTTKLVMFWIPICAGVNNTAAGIKEMPLLQELE
jgi:hypothetical protein